MLLLDEPFGALDANVRDELRQWLRRFHDEFHITSIFVTHDQEEAFEVADKIVVMKTAGSNRPAPPPEVFEHPANAFVMKFLGKVNNFQAVLQDGRVLFGNVEMPVGMHQIMPNGNGKADVYFRPHELDLDRTADAGNCLRGVVVHINPAGSVVKVRVMVEDFGLMVNVDISPEKHRRLGLKPTETIYVSPKGGKMFEPDYSI